MRDARLAERAASLPFAVLGLLLAHCLGYQLTGGHGRLPSAHGDHIGRHREHLLPVASFSFLLVVLVALAAIVAVRRHRRLPSPRLEVLVVVQLVGYSILEPSDIASAPVLLGLLLQVPVALVVQRLCRRAIAVVERLFAPPPVRPVHRALPVSPPPAPAFVRRPVLHWALEAGRRGPPVVATT